MASRPAAESTPPGTLIRSMYEPTFGLSWYSPYHFRRTTSSSEMSR